MSDVSPAPDVTRESGRPDSRQRREGRRLAWLGGIAVTLVAAQRIQDTRLSDPLLLALGGIMIVLATLPALWWAARGERQLPAFEVMMLATAPFYAFPLFDHPSTAFFSNDVLLRAALIVVTFQAVTLAVYVAVRGGPGRRRLWRESLLPEQYIRHTRIGMMFTTVYLFVSLYTNLVPPELVSITRAIFHGIGMLCAFIQMQQWGTGRLSGGDKVFVVANIVAQLILHVAGLYLITGASLFILVLISYTSASRRLPLAAVAAGLVFFGLLHTGKARMRAVYWLPDSPRVGLADLPGFFQEWFQASLTQSAESDEGVTSRLLERTSLFHILCVVVDFVPGRQPFLEGETYAGIPAQFVPRLLWPDKPGPHKSNTRLAVYLGFVPDEETAGKVSIAFGTPSEAYTNFGLLGVGLLGVFYGVLFKKLSTVTAHSPPLSVGGLSMVLLMAWSLQAEMTLSVWLSSLYQAAVVLIGIPVVLRALFGR